MEKLFKLRQHGTTVGTAVTAGLTTFLSMVYILAINPSILAASGMEPAAIFTATAVSAAIGTLFMAFLANYPVALASGMGLNAYFSYSVCIPMAEAGINDPWKIALTAVLVEGIVFVILTVTKFRETMVNKVPRNLKLGITAGIGLFIVIVGLIGAGVVVNSDSTLVTMGDMRSAGFWLAILGLIIIGIMIHFKVPGAILWGILITWLLGIFAQLMGWYQVDPEAGVASLIPDFSQGLKPAAPHLFAFDFGFVTSHVTEFIFIVFAFLFVDLFDTAGTLVGVANKGGLLDKDGNLPNAGPALLSDALGTIAGACLGTSTVTSYVESSAGVAVGGRTGLTALTSGLLFLVSLPLAPIFLAIPSFATAPALVYVGLLMMSSAKDMDFSDDMADVISGFMAMIMMPFTYSIANGIMFGFLTYVIIKVVTGKARDIHPVIWVCFALFIARIVAIVTGHA